MSLNIYFRKLVHWERKGNFYAHYGNTFKIGMLMLLYKQHKCLLTPDTEFEIQNAWKGIQLCF